MSTVEKRTSPPWFRPHAVPTSEKAPDRRSADRHALPGPGASMAVRDAAPFGGSRAGGRPRLFLLGPVRLQGRAGRSVSRLGSKGKALLAFLAARPDGCSEREVLAHLLWSESSEAEARHSLRQVLMTLRSRLGADADFVLHSDHDGVELRLDALDIDLRRLEAAAEAPGDGALIEACRLWRGPFCEGLDAGSEAYEEWLLLRRIQLEELASACLRQVAEMQIAAGCWAAAVGAAHRCIELDPFDESAHAMLIDLYRRLGWDGPARAAHRRCVELFRKELGEGPGMRVEEALRRQETG